jgi:hypothetical protein
MQLVINTCIIVLIILLAGCNREKCIVLDQDIGTTYTGECKDGFAHGEGYATGRDTYRGAFDSGEKHGFGIYTWGSPSEWEGNKYEGEWTHNNLTGKGKHSDPKGNVSEGDFVDLELHGQGKITDSDGIVSEGEYTHGALNGIGEIRVPQAYMIGRAFEDEENWNIENGYYKRHGLYRDGKFVISCTSLEECNQKLATKKADDETKKKQSEEQAKRAGEALGRMLVETATQNREAQAETARAQREQIELQKEAVRQSKRQAYEACRAGVEACKAGCLPTNYSCNSRCNHYCSLPF